MKIKKSGKFFKSLRFRILIILIILGIVPSVIVTEMVIANYEDRAIANRVQSMENICDIMCDLLIKENYLNDSSSQTVNSKLELLSNIYGGRILIVDRDFRIIKDTYGVDEGKTLVSQKVVNCFKGEDAYRYDSDSQKLILAVPVKSPEVNQVQGAMMIMASSSEVTSTIRELEQKGILIIGIIVVLAIFLGYILSTVLVKPFARVTKAIEDLTDGYQNEEISVPDYTETALITDAFNKMLSRMKTLDESRQEFVSNVSHELKTPMTSMKVLADSLVGQQGVPEELYQEFLSDITEEIDRENKIITDLLSLVKMDKKAADMNITNMNINEVVANRALELMGHQRGEYQYCSPNDHVNRSQSTNDAYPTAIHIGLYYTHLKLVKHFEVLIEAFRKVATDYPEAELVIVGDGPELDNLRQQANDLQLTDSIRFIGAVYDPKTLGAYMNESSIYVLAGMGGLSINDAMTYGMPVLCAVCDSTERDLVMEGKNGYFFKDGDADSLAGRIREMFESPERCKEMGKESERMIRENINMETVSERYLKAFQEILRLTHLRDSGN